MGNEPGKVRYVDVWMKLCTCPGPAQQVYSDGKRRYVHCDVCGKTWDVDKTMKRGIDERQT